MTYTEWLTWFLTHHDVRNEYRERRGQALFNSLYDFKTRLAEEIRGTDKDPFHNNRRIGAFLDYVERNW